MAPPPSDWLVEWVPAAEGERDRCSFYDAWLDSPRPFDLTRSYAEPADRSPHSSGTRWIEMAIEFDREFVEHAQGVVDLEMLAWAHNFDEFCFEWSCGLARFDLPVAYFPEFFDRQMIGGLAAFRLIAERDPGFFPRLRRHGASSELVRDANRILNPPIVTRKPIASSRSASLESIPAIVRRHVRATDNSPAPVIRRRPCNRARASRRRAPGRHQGSRRTPSRSAGGGSSGDDDGESEPSRLVPRWRHTGSHRLAEADAIRRYISGWAKRDLEEAGYLP